MLVLVLWHEMSVKNTRIYFLQSTIQCTTASCIVHVY
jgi:hypothetical protein